MRTDDLARHLKVQAREMQEWPLPALRPVRAHHTAGRRTTTLVLASVVAVVLALLVLPRLVQSRDSQPAPRPQPPAATPAHPPAGSQDWRALDCAPSSLGGCTTPDVLVRGAVPYHARSGGTAPTHHGTRRTAQLSLRVDVRAGPTSVLVGAVGSGDGSRLRVRFGAGPEIQLRPGRLTLLPVPRSAAHRVDVTVVERTRPLPRERLTIEEYAQGR